MTTTQHKRASIGAFIVCMNEEHQIRRCLESVKWCDSIVVVDSGSTDKTLEICKEYGCTIYQQAWPGYVEQKRFALSKCTTEWVLNLDADEEVSPQLQNEIELLLNKDDGSINGHQLSRVVYFLDKWWRAGGWYPEFRLRLCRRAATTWGGTDPHEKASVTGRISRLQGELHHYTYTNFNHQIRTLNTYSSQAAQSMFSRGKRATILKMFINPCGRFIKWYLIKRGYREGFPGLIIAVIEAFYVFLKYVKLWEMEKAEKKLNEA
jgi:glycosyltransferase involved in cell wall biosynthesis